MIDNYLTGIDYAIIGLYLVALVVLGFHLKARASSGLEQYLLGNRSLPWWMLGLSGVIDFWDLAGTIIIVSFLYLLGPRGLYIEFRGGAVLVLALQMLRAGKWHRRSGRLIAAEWMLFRFGDGPAGQAAQLARASAGIVLTLGSVAYLVKGTGLFLSMYLPYQQFSRQRTQPRRRDRSQPTGPHPQSGDAPRRDGGRHQRGRLRILIFDGRRRGEPRLCSDRRACGVLRRGRF